jgi:cobalt/nickel transport system permease protein
VHIPDGYLSPSTCAVAYAAALPFWYVATKRLGKGLNTRLVPLLSVVSAFSFVIMMFNLPLPGGTTGHAVGMAIAAILLGPWGAVVAISIALFIQALFFGDGGLTAFGANSLNMAILGSFVAYGVYRLVAGASAVTSPRRLVAAALAGYVAINVSALAAAVEFGLQPLLFHDAAGAPLYAPYPLSIAVPAMMAGHLTIAGFAEMLMTAGIFAFLQKSNPQLLQRHALSAHGQPASARGLALILGLLMVASPLGLLAAGTAWGEWAAADFADPAQRAAIAGASLGVAPPEVVPQGLARLSAIWTAPIPDYAPSFLKSEALGYLLSAVMGVGLIVLAYLALTAMLGLVRPRGNQHA